MLEAIQKALAGSRRLRVTFKKDSVEELPYLFGMVQAGIVQFEFPGDEMTLMAVSSSGDWEYDGNRTTTLKLTDSFDEEWFVGRMRRAVETAVAA